MVFSSEYSNQEECLGLSQCNVNEKWKVLLNGQMLGWGYGLNQKLNLSHK